MAYRRSICTRATLLSRRFSPSFSYISHDLVDNKKRSEGTGAGCRRIEGFLTQRRSFGSCIGNNSGPGTGFYNYGAVLGGVGNGVGGVRYMSTSTGEGAEKVGNLSEAAASITDGPVEAIASLAPVLSEVQIAATGSVMPVAAMQLVIDGVHSFTGFSWAASIALTTLLIRGMSIPLNLTQLRATSKLAMMKPRLEEIKEEMAAKANDPTAVQMGRQKIQALVNECGISQFTPFKAMIIQAPISICFFLAISNMAEKVPSFKNGGALWFTDLMTPDATYIFPVLTALSFLIKMEFSMQEGMEGNVVAQTMKKSSRGLAVLTLPLTLTFPKAIFCYWVTSNMFSFAYGLVLKLPRVKEALGIQNVAPLSTSDTQSNVSVFKALQQPAASGKFPAASGKPNPVFDRKPSPSSPPSLSAVLSQGLESSERRLKKRKNKRR